MNELNPQALLVIAFATVAGAVVGHVLIGLLIGLGVVLVATILRP